MNVGRRASVPNCLITSLIIGGLPFNNFCGGGGVIDNKLGFDSF